MGFVIFVWKEVGRIIGDEEFFGGSVSYWVFFKVLFVFILLVFFFFFVFYLGIMIYFLVFYKYFGFL